MDMLKLLIADGTEEFSMALTDTLRGGYIIRTCNDGRDTLELLRSFQPDVLVIDLMLPGLDGITLLQRASEAGLRPMVLVVSRLITDYILESAESMGIGYIMRKPCEIQAVAARVGDLSRRIHHPVLTQPDPRSAVSNMLLALGVPTKLKGYTYLRESVLLMAKNPGQSITKELYPAVAKICQCEAAHVERSSRSAIATAWSRGDNQIWQLYFPPGTGGGKQRPSNATFISRLADSLRLTEDEEAGSAIPHSPEISY